MGSESPDNSSWRGVPLSEIIGSQTPWGAPEFPLVSPAHNHAVLYHIPSNYQLSTDSPPKPQIGHDKWDHDHVRMPCSSKSLYPVEDENGVTHLRNRWQIIEDSLSKPIRNCSELIETILSYNTKFKDIWKFRALSTLFDERLDEEESQYFFNATLPQIAKLALDLPKLIQAPIPLLKQDQNKSVSLSQQQISSLLANAFFCTFPRRNTTKRSSEYSSYPHINFTSLFECAGSDDVLEKIKCLCHYFRRVCTKAPAGVVTVCRRAARSCPRWSSARTSLAALPLHVDAAGTIEDAHQLIQVDFANKYLGGGVLGYGCVQEEIRFVICPELIVSMLFTEALRPNEAILIIGSERYSRYLGYSRSFQWAGDYSDATPRDSSGRRRCAVLAIDALPYDSPHKQYQREMLTRELNKSWVGFSVFGSEDGSTNYPGVATGNWGCGAFGGSPHFKSLIQMMSCAESRRPMAYYTFGDAALRDEILAVYHLITRNGVTVGQLYQYLIRFSKTDVRWSHLHSFIRQAIEDDKKTPTDSMDVSVSSETEQLSNSIQKELLNNSPDLFSQEDLPSQNEADSESSTQERNITLQEENALCDIKIEQRTNLEQSKMPAKHLNTASSLISKLFEKMEKLDDDNRKLSLNSDDENKTVDKKHTNEASNQTTRLFEELQKFDDEQGKLNINVSFVENNMTVKETKMATGSHNSKYSNITEEHKMADRETKMEDRETKMEDISRNPENISSGMSSSWLNEEEEKIHNESPKRNSSAHTTPVNQRKKVLYDGETAMECDNKSPSIKKLVAKKITDFYNKK